MKELLTTTAILEAGVGAGLLIAPGALVGLLLGAPLEGPVAAAVARVAGGALLALAAACWLARNDSGRRAARGMALAMLLYNLAAAAVLLHAGAIEKLGGVGLWPTVVLHGALAIWCIASLMGTQRTTSGSGPTGNWTMNRHYARRKTP